MSGQLFAHHNHASDPKEENIVTGLEKRARVEFAEIGTRLFWPFADREWEDTGGEPRVQHVFVVIQLDLVLGDIREAFVGLF